jgi:integrase
VAHVEDRWTRPTGTVDKRGRPVREHTDRYGSGLRYVAQWTEHGRRRTKSFRTKDGAEAHLADIARAVRDGTHVETAKVTVAEFAEQWMREQLHQRDRTKLLIATRWRRDIAPLLGHLPIQSVTRRHIQAAATKWDKDHEPATVKGIYTYVNAIFSAAEKERVIPVNPCIDIKLPAMKRGKVVPMPVSQVWECAERVHPQYQGLVLLAAATGMRSGELRGLTLDRITFGEPTRIRIDRQLATTLPTWGEPKGDERHLTIDRHTVDMLAWHMTRVPPHPTGLIFTGDQGGPLNPATISEQLRAAGKAMNLPPRFGLHAFRHHHASLLIAAGLSPTAVAARLGHKSPNLTLAVYAHLWQDDEDRAREAIERQLWG